MAKYPENTQLLKSLINQFRYEELFDIRPITEFGFWNLKFQIMIGIKLAMFGVSEKNDNSSCLDDSFVYSNKHHISGISSSSFSV